MEKLNENATHSKPNMSRLGVWAMALGCSVGWGAFVMPGTMFLNMAGPIGGAIAVIIGAFIILIIGKNFHFMMERVPDNGGAFSYAKDTLGYDNAFLSFWSLILAYLSIMWANATALSLIARYMIGDLLMWGFHYNIAGYDVYLGEILVTIVILVIFGLIISRSKRTSCVLNTVLAVVLFFGAIFCFIGVVSKNTNLSAAFDPPFAGEKSPAVGIFNIIALAPWAFIGFEAISHTVADFRFPIKKSFGVITAAVLSGALIYIIYTLISAMSVPSEYSGWLDYISDLDNQTGIELRPAFNAVKNSMGSSGLILLAVTIIAAISTSLLGLYRAVGNLMQRMAQEKLLPSRFAETNSKGIPQNAILTVMAISLVIPFIGRAAIGWITDITTISASIAYGYTSLCSFIVAKKENNTFIKVTSVIGVAVSVVFFFFPLIPNLFSMSYLATESYLILAAWSIVGFILYRSLFKSDESGRFGKSTVMWMVVLFLIFFSSTMWMRQATHDTTEKAVKSISNFYLRELEKHNIKYDKKFEDEEMAAVSAQMNSVSSDLLSNSLIQMALIIVSLIIMFNIYSILRKREKSLEAQRIQAEESSKAKTVFLSNMSHDIRTPMNAIIGYTDIALKKDTNVEEMRGHLEKISASSKHLLALINDVLEMSRIESGKMDLDESETDICHTVETVYDMFVNQMESKNITFSADISNVTDKYVFCDINRLNRVLLNLVSNAYKFTPENGTISLRLTQKGKVDGKGEYELRVKDSGIGMSEEFAAKVFEAFEREKTSTVSGIQGTGLGMAITKSIIDLMGGTIIVNTTKGKGTEFVINISFKLSDKVDSIEDTANTSGEEITEANIFEGKKLLLVEDVEINREIAEVVLTDMGFIVDMAVNGKDAVDKVAASSAGDIDIILMDIQMPIMNGYEATGKIRAMENNPLSSVPIVAMTANAFAEDIKAATDAGMNAHIAKPLDIAAMTVTLKDVLLKRK